MDNLKRLEKEAKTDVEKAPSLGVLSEVRTKWMGRKGRLTGVLRSLKDLPEKKKKRFGKEANLLKATLEKLFEVRTEELVKIQKEQTLKTERIDATLPGTGVLPGHVHPITMAIREINSTFQKLGFSIVEGPEVETEWYNFDALNIPSDHPARDLWDTFWLHHDGDDAKTPDGNRLLLRTHTSPVQVRYMQHNQPPFRIIVPGKVFRYEATDASHDIEFHQVEGLMVGEDTSVANFKYVIHHFFQEFFALKSKKIKISLRPSYFPFTEPSFEVWISCIHCLQKGCAVCRKSGWLEVAGAGMVNPHVFKNAGFNPANLQGFAFGVGVERLAMMKYRVPDIRLFHSRDPRFLKQF